ncbi:hypothetical protein LX87_02285 [Larkinella arboricola]|uniref:Uncharacterized protein n=1 Tax=Larkinella arboricola TaxID=643671 RepID=A0A327WY65_LARAB|nr:hypothetical protein [Larkinella arboricola]RAJ97385.1 hypothetical protein LX87_02285 [Larkinella arboricola]
MKRSDKITLLTSVLNGQVNGLKALKAQNQIQSMVAIARSDTFRNPSPDDRVSLSTSYRSGNNVRQEMSYAQFQDHIQKNKGFLLILPDNKRGRFFSEKTD